MRTHAHWFVRSLTRAAKEVISMIRNQLESMRPYRLRDLLFYVCDCVLRRLPGAIVWIIVRHAIRAKTGFYLNF